MMFFSKTSHGAGAALPPRPAPLGVGATRTNFIAPTADQVAASPPGTDLTNAANALLNYFSANGVPSMHVAVSQVTAFQQAWDADPLSTLNSGNSSLDIDGGYGPNTHDALASINGGSAPPVSGAPGGGGGGGGGAGGGGGGGGGGTPGLPGTPGGPGSAGTAGGVPTWVWWTAGGLAAGGTALILASTQTGKKVTSRARYHLTRARAHARRLVTRRRR